MKRFRFLLGLCLAAFVAIGTAHRVASACSSTFYASNDDGDHIHCNFVKADANYCYYDCECHNYRGGGDCSDLYDQFGLT